MTSPTAAPSHGHLLRGASIHSSNLQSTEFTEVPTPTMPAPRLGTVRLHVADNCPASRRTVRFSAARPASYLSIPRSRGNPNTPRPQDTWGGPGPRALPGACPIHVSRTNARPKLTAVISWKGTPTDGHSDFYKLSP